MNDSLKNNTKPSARLLRESMAKKTGLLVVLSSPSGGGKTTIYRKLLQKNPDFLYSVSVTTRAPRHGEKDGIHYTFVNHAKFQRLIDMEHLAEYATVHGELYGTPKKNIVQALKCKRVIVFDLDVVGGLALKRQYPETVLIFLTPPSWEVLRARMVGRKSETEAQVQRRLSRARRELPYWRMYDYVVVNDRLADSVVDCLAIIRAERLRSIRAPRFRGPRPVPIEKLEE